jgi:hypothetical protein
MKKLIETPIGNVTPNTFRPTEAQKAILMNIATMQEQGRTVTQQDAINVSPEKLKELQVGEDNLEAAYQQLIKIGMIGVQPDQTLVINKSGMAVVDEIKKAQEQEALTQQSDSGHGDSNPNPMASPSPMEDPTFAGNPMGESFSLIKYLNDYSKL